MKKQKFIRIYESWKEDTSILTKYEKGQLIDALVEYLITGEEKELQGNERYLYPQFIRIIKQEQETHRTRFEGKEHD